MRARRREKWCNRHESCRWRRLYRKYPQFWRSYARALSWCESRNRRVAREGGFWSYFQWTLRTWWAQGGRGNPESASWHEQAVRAIRLTQQVGIHSTAGFPNCPKGW